MTTPTKGFQAHKALMAGAAIVSITAGVSGTAQAATGTGTAEAILLTPIAITAPVNLHFGELTVRAAGAGGAVIMAPVAGRSLSGGTTAGDVTLLSRAVPIATEAPGEINIVGAPSAALDVAIPAGVDADTQGGVAITDGYLLTTGAGLATTEQIVIGDFNLNTDAAGNSITATLTAGGSLAANILVGATALIKAGNVAGTYTGTYNITVDYQ